MRSVGRARGCREATTLFPHWSELRVLFMSGYTAETLAARGASTASVAFVQKPFTPAVLLAGVRQVLDAR